jgi:hypothetical protein
LLFKVCGVPNTWLQKFASLFRSVRARLQTCHYSVRLLDAEQVATVSAFLTVGPFKPAKAHGWESAKRGYQL